ncbi:hypothetical protein BRY73_08425 [Ochrobactrum sp. P6BS-III]|uniref:hypothetical protein n=1 Tax=unclassified Ochrobactrum TaxID=239106 RepID=UPI0009923DC2|nr:hypothetical protein [Ochrobactrum sp. P6BSIII]OOL18074.1 hypothetical protein BRY73_08425 [Ochrobactrum sp. P6BS-III]
MRSNTIRKAKQELIEAECAAETALGAVLVAKDNYRERLLASARVADIMTVLDYDTGGRDISRQRAIPFAKALASGLLWEQAGNTTLTARYISNALPCLSTAEIEEIIACPCRMSNQDVARLLHVSLEKRQMLGLSMIGACDLSDEEFAAFRKVDDLRRRAARKRRARPRNIDQRREEEQAKSLAIAEFAKANGVAPKTVKNWIANGKAIVEIVRENGVPSIIVYRGDAKIPNSATGQTPAACKTKLPVIDFSTGPTAGGSETRPRDDFRILAFGRLAQLLEKGAAS